MVISVQTVLLQCLLEAKVSSGNALVPLEEIHGVFKASSLQYNGACLRKPVDHEERSQCCTDQVGFGKAVELLVCAVLYLRC
jgi:hypothetical protein